MKIWPFHRHDYVPFKASWLHTTFGDNPVTVVSSKCACGKLYVYRIYDAYLTLAEITE